MLISGQPDARRLIQHAQYNTQCQTTQCPTNYSQRCDDPIGSHHPAPFRRCRADQMSVMGHIRIEHGPACSTSAAVSHRELYYIRIIIIIIIIAIAIIVAGAAVSVHFIRMPLIWVPIGDYRAIGAPYLMAHAFDSLCHTRTLEKQTGASIIYLLECWRECQTTSGSISHTFV